MSKQQRNGSASRKTNRKVAKATQEKAVPTPVDLTHSELTDVEAGAYMRLNPKTLANWRSKGRGPKFLKIGGRVLYPRAELDAYKASCLRQSTSQQAQVTA